jgi:hypothetical protein
MGGHGGRLLEDFDRVVRRIRPRRWGAPSFRRDGEEFGQDLADRIREQAEPFMI